MVAADPVTVHELPGPVPDPGEVREVLDRLDDVPAVDDGGAPAGAVGGAWLVLLGHALGLGTGRVRVPPPPVAGPVTPVATLAWHDHLLRHDGTTWWAEALDEGDGAATARAERLATEVAAAVARHVRQPASRTGPARPARARLAAAPDGAAHMAAVERCVTAIRAGDIAQANVCTRFDVALPDGGPAAAAAWSDLVERLRPARAALVTGPWGALVSASPELYLDVAPGPGGARVASAPIKGTQPAGREAVLAASAKDAAENVMIVDLLRNDLSRVCRPGSVEATALLRVERHAGVAHLVSRVEGDAAPGTGVGELVAATFPPASVTGTPKQRATELTNALEGAARGAHTGAAGLVAPGRTELAVTIRALEVAADGRAALGVGGGIVADSTPAEEWTEVLAKAGPVLRAIGAEAPEPEAATRGSKGLADPARGLVDTLLVVDGRAVEAASHAARLRRSYWETYGVALAADVEGIVAERSRSLGPGTWRLRLRATPGDPGRVAAETTPWQRPRPPDAQLGLVLELQPAPRPGLERHKYADRSWLAAAAVQAGVGVPGGPDDLAFADPAGGLLETTRACLVALADGRLVTAPLDGRILPGVTRQVLVDLAVAAGVGVELAAPGPDRLARADGLLAVNALRGVEWVRRLGPWTWDGPVPLARDLAHRLLDRWGLAAPSSPDPARNGSLAR